MSLLEKQVPRLGNPDVANDQQLPAPRWSRQNFRDSFSFKTCAVTVLAFSGIALVGHAFRTCAPHDTAVQASHNARPYPLATWKLDFYLSDGRPAKCDDFDRQETGTNNRGCTTISGFNDRSINFDGVDRWDICLYKQNNCNGEGANLGSKSGCSFAPNAYAIIAHGGDCP